jgi:hypothetical protein
MRSNITIVIKHDDNFDISLLFIVQVSTFDTIIAIENIAINQNIEISPNPSFIKTWLAIYKNYKLKNSRLHEIVCLRKTNCQKKRVKHLYVH